MLLGPATTLFPGPGMLWAMAQVCSRGERRKHFGKGHCHASAVSECIEPMVTLVLAHCKCLQSGNGFMLPYGTERPLGKLTLSMCDIRGNAGVEKQQLRPTPHLHPTACQWGKNGQK